MKSIIRKIAAIMLAALIAMPVATSGVHASSEVTVSGNNSVKGGEVFTVTISYDGDYIGRVVGDVTYDTEMISYISGGSSSGNVGYVELKKAGTGEALVFNLKFQALKEGSTSIDVSTSEMYDLDDVFMDTPAASKTIKITGDADEDEVIEETTEPDDQAADEAQSVDEKDSSSESTASSEAAADEESDAAEESSTMGKNIMFVVIGIVLVLVAVLVFRRKK